MLCEAKTGYISNMEIYTAEGKKLNDTVTSVLENNVCVHHHVYQDNFYNSVNLAENLLKRNIRVCGTMRPNRGIPKDLEKEVKGLKKGQLSFRRKGDVLVQVWTDKRLVRMMSTIHDSEHVHKGKKDRKTNEQISKPNCVVQHKKYMKGVDHADQYLSYYSIVRKTVKWPQMVVLFLLNCALFNSFLMYKTLNKGTREQKYKKFLHEVAQNWIMERGDVVDSSSDEENAVPSEKRPTPRAPSEDPPGRLSGNFSKHKFCKIVGAGKSIQ
jgi:hypothetical protein